MTLHLTATTIEEKALKEYLEQTVSEELAEKINNGMPVEKDGKKLISKKTLASFMKYATEEAQKQAVKGATWACLHSDIVFGWAIHYFEEDSILGTLYNEDGTEYIPPKPAHKTIPKSADVPVIAPISKPQPKTGQMSMFDLMDEDDTPVEPVEQESAPEIETMAAPAVSPLYTRYQQYQEAHPDSLIAMRVGDFYEVFGDATVTAAKALDLTLASRDLGLAERVPMIGFPYHKADYYIEQIRTFANLAMIDSDTETRIFPQYKPVNGFEIDTATGEVIEHTEEGSAPQDPYGDTELMYKLYLLLDKKVEIVR